MKPGPPRIDISTAMAAVVEKLGGEVLDRTLRGNRAFHNADYLFQIEGVVAELKCLQADIESSPEFQRKIEALYRRWQSEGKVPLQVGSLLHIRTAEIPEECSHEILNVLRGKLGDEIKKANRQIRETKQHFRLPSARGLLILAADGNLTYTPTLLFHLLARLLNGQYKSINSIIYYSPNDPMIIPGATEPMLAWFPLRMEDREPVPERFLEQLQSAWMSEHSRHLGDVPLRLIAGGSDPDMLDQIRFKRDRRTRK